MDQATFFLDASQELRRLFEKGFVTRNIAAGETLFEQGDFDDRLYVLDEGLLEVSIYSVAGRKLSLNLLRPGSVFGEIAMFDPGPRTARIAAVEESRVRSLSKSAVLDATLKEPHLSAELLSFAGKRMRWLSQQVEQQVFLPPAARLAAKVLYLASESGQIRMSQAQLADFVGVTREVVSKTLAEWQREGFVTVSRGKIAVIAPDALEGIASSSVG